jgi:hypothetical protein
MSENVALCDDGDDMMMLMTLRSKKIHPVWDRFDKIWNISIQV